MYSSNSHIQSESCKSLIWHCYHFMKSPSSQNKKTDYLWLMKLISDNNSMSCYISGQLHAYIRDCSNGKNFSTPDFPQFAYLQPKLNHSICVYRTKILYCITLCNSGDFCNGPQIDSGCIHPHAQMWMILSIVLTLFITRVW